MTTEQVQTLLLELEVLRRNIVNLMSEEAREILGSYVECENRAGSYRWRRLAAQRIIALTKPFPTGIFKSPDRAYCPLCRESAIVPYERGFKLPEGLRRHLIGHGDIHNQCTVFRAAIDLAHAYWNIRFREEDAVAAAERLQQRRLSETLYYFGPGEPLLLIDEGMQYRTARNEDSLAWAQDRLAEFGFEVHQEGNVKSYILSSETFIVYADPRALGDISFAVYMKSSAKRESKHEDDLFWFKDNWKNDISRRFRARLLRATKEPNDPYFLPLAG